MRTILKDNVLLFVLIGSFILIRFLGLDQFYHQDEYRWVDIADSIANSSLGLASPHPPLMQGLFYVFSVFEKIFNYNNLRLIPLLFSVLCFVLVYRISLRYDKNRKMAYVAIGLFTLNVYSSIASLQLDIDGAILPFFVLLSYYFYLRSVIDGDKRFILPFLVAIAGGFLAKLSFTLFVGALAADYFWTVYERGEFKAGIKKFFYLFGGLVLSAGAFYVFYGSGHPWFVEYTLNHLQTARSFGSRSYFDLFLRLFKFFIWLSPLLTLPVVYGIFKKEIFSKYRIWYVYIFFNLLFYLVVFNFSTLPIERYLMSLIIPAVFISSDVICSFIKKLKINRSFLFLSIAGFVLLATITVLMNSEVMPLNPKEAYVDKLKSLDFNFLIPLTGGSGPIGFYVSAQFILWAWVICAIGLTLNKKSWAVYLFVIFGFGYNTLLSNEFLFGNLYGSVDKITKKSVEYVINNQEIDGVITYYDAGVYYLKKADKYDSRFYTAPKRDYTPKMTSYRGHYMIVDFPAIDKESRYWKLISRCELDKKFTDKYLDSYIFDCRGLPQNQL
ncbi:MAG TPA: hypothetical protein VI978_01585 [Candidatus Paceibacterota bacterium]